jgi:hypothetical protein
MPWKLGICPDPDRPGRSTSPDALAVPPANHPGRTASQEYLLSSRQNLRVISGSVNLKRERVLEQKGRDYLMPGDDGTGQRDRELARLTTIVLAEFAGLRNENVARINLLATLILGNLTVLGVVLGIALNHSGNAIVLLLLPIVTPCIGMLVIDSFRNAGLVVRYIHTVIWPQLQIKVNDTEIFRWEQWSIKRTLTPLFASPFLFVLALEFLGLPIAVLAYAIQHPHVQVSTLQYWLWWTGTLLTAILIFYALCYGAYSVLHPRGPRKTILSRRERTGR